MKTRQILLILGFFFLPIFILLILSKITPDPAENDFLIHQDFETFFDETQIHHLKIMISKEEWGNLSNDLVKSEDGQKFQSEIYRRADFLNLDSGEFFSNVGLRVRGNFSRELPESAGFFHQVHWKISFSTEFDGHENVYGSSEIPTVRKNKRTLYGIRSLNLKFAYQDPSFVSEALCFSLFEDAGIPASRFTFANLEIEIEGYTNLNYGIYTVFEPVDKEFLERRFGEESFLFKCGFKNGIANLGTNLINHNGESLIGIEKPDPKNRFEARFWDAEEDPYFPSYDLKTLEENFNLAKSLLEELIFGVNTLEGDEFAEWIANQIDTDGFLKIMAMDALVGMRDGYWGNYNNYFLALCPTNRKWTFIPYDYDRTFTNASSSETDERVASATNWGAEGGWKDGNHAVLMNKMMEIEEFQNRYFEILLAFTDPEEGIYTAEKIEAKITAYQNVIDSDANADDICFRAVPETWGEIRFWQGYYPEYSEVILDFASNRVRIVDQELGEAE